MTRRQRDLGQGHEYVLERLSPYIDEQLQVKDRARVEAHLSACPICRDELRTLQWTRSLLRQAPPVPLPRSFVIREADLAPRQTARRRAGRRPAFALQWATALVAILLVVVVAGDVFLGGRLAAPGGQQEVALLSAETPMVVASVVVERETVIEAPAVAAAPQEDAEAGTPAESTQRAITPTAASARAMEASKTPEQAETLEQSGPVTSTTAAPPLALEGAPQEETAETVAEGNASPESATPQSPAEPAQGYQGTVTTPPPDQKTLKRPAGTPLAMAPPETAQPDDTMLAPMIAEPSERGIQPGSPAMLVRAGWRVAEVGLGLLLTGLIVAVIWVRRRK